MDGLKIRLGLLGLGLAGFAVLSPLQAETASGPPLRMSTPEVATELLASVAAARPGTEILLGVRQQIAPGWHTYWRNPGDSGMATRISWTLPAGARGGELLWPAPRRFAEGSDSVFGYQDEVTLLSRVQLPATPPVEGAYRFRARISWLVCKTECLPQEADLALSLPVAAPQPRGAPGAMPPALARALAALPQPLPAKAQTVRRREDRLDLQLDLPVTVPPPRSAWFFPLQWGHIQQGAAQAMQWKKGPLSLQLSLQLLPGDQPPQPGEALPGVLVLERGDGAATRRQSKAALISG